MVRSNENTQTFFSNVGSSELLNTFRCTELRVKLAEELHRGLFEAGTIPVAEMLPFADDDEMSPIQKAVMAHFDDEGRPDSVLTALVWSLDLSSNNHVLNSPKVENGLRLFLLGLLQHLTPLLGWRSELDSSQGVGFDPNQYPTSINNCMKYLEEVISLISPMILNRLDPSKYQLPIDKPVNQQVWNQFIKLYLGNDRYPIEYCGQRAGYVIAKNYYSQLFSSFSLDNWKEITNFWIAYLSRNDVFPNLKTAVSVELTLDDLQPLARNPSQHRGMSSTELSYMSNDGQYLFATGVAKFLYPILTPKPNQLKSRRDYLVLPPTDFWPLINFAIQVSAPSILQLLGVDTDGLNEFQLRKLLQHEFFSKLPQNCMLAGERVGKVLVEAMAIRILYTDVKQFNRRVTRFSPICPFTEVEVAYLNQRAQKAQVNYWQFVENIHQPNGLESLSEAELSVFMVVRQRVESVLRILAKGTITNEVQNWIADTYSEQVSRPVVRTDLQTQKEHDYKQIIDSGRRHSRRRTLQDCLLRVLSNTDADEVNELDLFSYAVIYVLRNHLGLSPALIQLVTEKHLESELLLELQPLIELCYALCYSVVLPDLGYTGVGHSSENIKIEFIQRFIKPKNLPSYGFGLVVGEIIDETLMDNLPFFQQTMREAQATSEESNETRLEFSLVESEKQLFAFEETSETEHAEVITPEKKRLVDKFFDSLAKTLFGLVDNPEELIDAMNKILGPLNMGFQVNVAAVSPIDYFSYLQSREVLNIYIFDMLTKAKKSFLATQINDRIDGGSETVDVGGYLGLYEFIQHILWQHQQLPPEQFRTQHAPDAWERQQQIGMRSMRRVYFTLMQHVNSLLFVLNGKPDNQTLKVIIKSAISQNLLPTEHSKALEEKKM